MTPPFAKTVNAKQISSILPGILDNSDHINEIDEFAYYEIIRNNDVIGTTNSLTYRDYPTVNGTGLFKSPVYRALVSLFG